MQQKRLKGFILTVSQFRISFVFILGRQKLALRDVWYTEYITAMVIKLIVVFFIYKTSVST